MPTSRKPARHAQDARRDKDIAKKRLKMEPPALGLLEGQEKPIAEGRKNKTDS